MSNAKEEIYAQDIIFGTFGGCFCSDGLPCCLCQRPGPLHDAHMKQMDDMIAKMTDAAKKKEATTALDMSKAAMKKGDKAGCMQHMNEAHKAMGL
jgi:hypothetical protein